MILCREALTSLWRCPRWLPCGDCHHDSGNHESGGHCQNSGHYHAGSHHQWHHGRTCHGPPRKRQPRRGGGRSLSTKTAATSYLVEHVRDHAVAPCTERVVLRGVGEPASADDPDGGGGVVGAARHVVQEAGVPRVEGAGGAVGRHARVASGTSDITRACTGCSQPPRRMAGRGRGRAAGQPERSCDAKDQARHGALCGMARAGATPGARGLDARWRPNWPCIVRVDFPAWGWLKSITARTIFSIILADPMFCWTRHHRAASVVA